MKYLGLDYGAKHVGLAVSDGTGSIAFPLEIVATGIALARVTQLIEEKKIEALVIGDTRSHGGGENPVTKEAERFAEALARETSLPVSRAFEAWSSIEASRYAPEGSEHNDAAAAAVILQRYLDMHSRAVD